jgi:transglutaminase-like putative cysteine protease
MLYRIGHRTEYRFDKPVFLEPHRLLLRPLQTHRQQLLEYDIRIDPNPAGHTLFTDVENNPGQLVWFDGSHHQLHMEVLATVSVPDFNPFGFLIYPLDCARLGFRYPAGLEALLAPYLNIPVRGRPLNQKLEAIRRNSGEEVMDFINASLADLHGSIERIVREEGDPLPPEETLMSSKGSCRDITLLHMTLLRGAGLACRFVSGYLYHHGEEEDHELHAWTEVYLPGAGWVGLDPTLGLWVQADHIALAASAQPIGTMPVTGTFRGDAGASMSASVRIRRMEEGGK